MVHLVLHTVEHGHQGDAPKCPYYPGVRIKRAVRKRPGHMFYRYKADKFTATKRFVTATSAN